MKAARFLAAIAVALLGAGCTTLTPQSDAGDECARWFAALDTAVDAAGVRDAQDERIAGFAGLRVDRFGMATRQSAAFDAWLERAARLDREARDAETANLPIASYPIDGTATASAARARSDGCRATWSLRLAADPAARQQLLERATVPDRYSTGLRAVGLYPLVRWPFFAGVQAWQDGHAKAIAEWQRKPPPILRFVPEQGDAPIFEIEASDDGALAPFDRFGVPTWSENGTAPRIDTTQPVLYRRDSQTLLGSRVLRQRVYTLWFPERPRTNAFDLPGGALDGVIVRITDGPDGHPLLMDTIHACGCYHLFFSGADLRARDDAPSTQEWLFAPARLPPLRAGDRLVVRIASATHYVTGVAIDGGADGQRYELRDENQLRSLPLPVGGQRSLYGPDGIVAGSERAERLLFWPMGIASAGAMRQWGHHATAFVGRRHFDDADLIERRFTLTLSVPE